MEFGKKQSYEYVTFVLLPLSLFSESQMYLKVGLSGRIDEAYIECHIKCPKRRFFLKATSAAAELRESKYLT